VNNNVCLVAFANGAGQLVAATVSPSTSTTINLCGIVSAYTPATSTTLGSLTIGSLFYPVAVNAAAFTGTTVQNNANVCIAATLNGLGQITGGAAQANPVTTTTTPVYTCGTLQSYTAAAGTTLATIVFSSPVANFTVASGTTVSNTSLAAPGALVCLVGQSNGTQLTSASFTPLALTTITVCGTVTTYTPATNSTVGSLAIGGTTVALAVNLAPSGAAITLGTNDCVVLTLNSIGQAVAAAVTAQTATATPTPTVTGTPATATPTTTPTSISICGLVTNYVAASSTANGTLTINGFIVGLAVGFTVSGVTLANGANVRINGPLNSTQQLTSGVVTVNSVSATVTPTTTLVVCGIITNLVAPSAATNGTLTINGQTVGLAVGFVSSGITLVTGANVCISGSLNSTQQLTTAVVTANGVTATATSVAPPPPPPPGAATATPTATATPLPPTATATPTAVPATSTPVPPAPTNTPKPSKPPKPTATATTAPAVSGGGAPQPQPTAVPPPAQIPSTGFGGSAFARNAAVGRAFRTAGSGAVAPAGIVTAPGNASGSDPMSPAVPAVLGLVAIGFGVLARRLRVRGN
jgi:outer membrane biosynthesis protein TonB